MSEYFSPELIARCQRIFEEKSGRVIGAEEADIILDRLAQLGMTMFRVAEHRLQKGGEQDE